MLKKLFENGGRKLWLVAGVIVLAVLNDILPLGISEETIRWSLTAAVGGSGTIALEDGLKALLGWKKPEGDVTVNNNTEEKP